MYKIRVREMVKIQYSVCFFLRVFLSSIISALYIRIWLTDIQNFHIFTAIFTFFIICVVVLPHIILILSAITSTSLLLFLFLCVLGGTIWVKLWSSFYFQLSDLSFSIVSGIEYRILLLMQFEDHLKLLQNI
jgi:hypothetical protein